METVRFQTDWFPQAEHGGFYQAQAKGFYRDAGINVEIMSGGPATAPLLKLMGGYCDAVMVPSTDVITRASRGLPLVIVGVYFQRDPQGILLHDEDTVRDFKDLNGRVIMANPETVWGTYIKLRYHIDFRNVPLNYGMGEFMAEKTYIQQCFVTNEPYYVRLHGGHPRTLPIYDSGYNPYRTICTTRSFLARHPQAVRAFVAASLRGWRDFMEGDPTPGKQLILKSNPQTTEDFVDFAINAMREYKIVSGEPKLGERIGLMTRKRLLDQERIMKEIGEIAELGPMERYVTFDYEPDDLRADASR